MDEATLDELGMVPLAPILSQVTSVKDEASFYATLGKLHAGFFAGGGALFVFFIEPDAKRPDVYVATLVQGGTGLPDRDFYLKTDDASRKLLAAYQAQVARMLGFLGEAPDVAANQAAAIVGFETRLATIARPRADLRDPDSAYHMLGTTGVQQLDPRTPWTGYWAALGYPKIGADLNVMTPEYFKQRAKVAWTRSKPERYLLFPGKGIQFTDIDPEAQT